MQPSQPIQDDDQARDKIVSVRSRISAIPQTLFFFNVNLVSMLRDARVIHVRDMILARLQQEEWS
jgi:hypothetical protein